MLLILSSQSALLRNPFSGSKQDLAPRANLFKLSFGRGICRIDDCQWQHFPSWQVPPPTPNPVTHIRLERIRPLFMKGFYSEWRCLRRSMCVFPCVLFWANGISRSPTWGYFWLSSFLHVLSTDLFSKGAPHYYWQASQQLWKHKAYVKQMLPLHSQTEFSGRQKYQWHRLPPVSCSPFLSKLQWGEPCKIHCRHKNFQKKMANLALCL